jgi:hypothetical protein
MLTGKKLSRFPTHLTEAAFGLVADVVMQPGVWTTIGQYVIPAQQEATFGIGMVGAPDNQGLLYLRSDNLIGAAVIPGSYRGIIANANQTKSVTVFQHRSELLAPAAIIRDNCVLLPEFSIRGKEDDILMLEMFPDGAIAVTLDESDADTQWLIPVTTFQ